MHFVRCIVSGDDNFSVEMAGERSMMGTRMTKIDLSGTKKNKYQALAMKRNYTNKRKNNVVSNGRKTIPYLRQTSVSYRHLQALAE